MKRLWFALIFLFIAAGLCFAEQYYINDFYNNLSEKISAAERYEKDGDAQLSEAISDIQDYWQKHNDLIFTLTNHGVLNDLSSEIHSLNTENAKEGLPKTRAFLIAFYENQRITFANIF